MQHIVRLTALALAALAGSASAQTVGFATLPPGSILHAQASVIAKVLRDQRWAEIRGRYSDEFGEIIGGGYVNDGTRRFLRAYAERYGALPPEARRSWPHSYVHDLIGDQRPAGPQMSLL